ncbi:MAG: helix-hairpin-helix domain-containing protein [Anaerolineae bacterium]|jgi:predicted flap endonuclease-1-like 5' DNA nuclease
MSHLFALTSLALAAAETEGNPWWLWIAVLVIIAAFVGFMIWWWLREPEEEAPLAQSKEAATPEAPAPEAEPDDLKVIEGIGPKIASVLQNAGIQTFAALAALDPQRIEEILAAESANLLRLANPATWPEQAGLAAEGRWQELEKLQDELKGGRRA